jgi:hypothetical protein
MTPEQDWKRYQAAKAKLRATIEKARRIQAEARAEDQAEAEAAAARHRLMTVDSRRMPIHGGHYQGCVLSALGHVIHRMRLGARENLGRVRRHSWA